MSISIVTPRPWTVDQELTASDGSKYIASGANSAKPLCDYELVEGPQGPVGDVGGQGIAGENGEDGDDGFSPSASCSVTDNRLNIEINNAFGTTSKDLDVCPSP